MILIPQNLLHEYTLAFAYIFEDVSGSYYVLARVEMDDQLITIHFADSAGKLKHYKKITTIVELLRSHNVQRFEVKLYE